jgi:hypothetical protein
MYADVSTWEKVTAIATAVGGLGAMLGAGAAWLAARSSLQASRDAREALATSLKPQVQLNFEQEIAAEGTHGRVVARVTVVGPLSPAGLVGVFPAADVRVEFTLASGKEGSNSIAVLEPTAGRLAPGERYLQVVIAEPTDDWPPPNGDHATATVTYSDIRGAGTYRLSRSVDLRRPADPESAGAGVVSFPNLTEPTETRMNP